MYSVHAIKNISETDEDERQNDWTSGKIIWEEVSISIFKMEINGCKDIVKLIYIFPQLFVLLLRENINRNMGQIKISSGFIICK